MLLLTVVVSIASVLFVKADDSLEKWFTQNGGYLSSKLILTAEGVFAKEDIPAKELILKAPPETILGAKEDLGNPINCEAIQNLLHEQRLGKASTYAPLLESLPSSTSPGTWSDAAQELLDELLGRDEEGQDLPPMGATWYLETNYEECHGSESDSSSAALFAHQNVIVPFMNFFRHRNGHHTNVDYTALYYGETIDFRATQDIRQGQQLYISLDQCHFCHEEMYGTPELFRDYGFVEEYPQRWTFPGIDLVADIDEISNINGEPAEGHEVYWISHAPSAEIVGDLEEYLEHLEQVGEKLSGADVPEEELELIVQYHEALTEAVALIISNIADENEYVGPSMEAEYTGEDKELIDWFVEQGGYLNPKLEIKTVNPSDPNSRKGIFAKEDLNPNELLVFVPRAAALEAPEEEDEPGTPLSCPAVYMLIDHINQGDKSDFAPFIKYMVDNRASLPSDWSKAGQDLLIDVLGMETDREILPPLNSRDWITNDWLDICEGPDDPTARIAAIITVSEALDDMFVPIIGIFSHRNGVELNTKSSGSIVSNDEMVVRTSKNVKAGTELHISQNRCTDCEDRKQKYGVAELFRDYGIVEDYPRQYVFNEEEFAFEVDEVRDGSGNPTGELVATVLFDDEPLSDENVEYLRQQFEGLRTFADFEWKHIKNVPEKEKELVGKFLDAHLRDLPVAIAKFTGEDLKIGCALDKEECPVGKAAFLTLGTEPLENDVFETTICNINSILRFDNWEDTDSCQSLYQRMTFSNDLANNNTCFDLDNTVQICSDYRPQYHELQVQYAARFLGDIKRIIWVGGGDSMLLHEILKYPNLELAVGLELDQNVTRLSFKHFGTQPHWDDERVEWWFGDASKSMLMLPKSYFNSFDLVLVDLSETVMSFKVTNELDIVEALTLLMKPDGIFVKNEFYFEKMSSIFKHTLQIYVNDVPMICQQTMNFGSNQVDFLEKFRSATNHGVETLYVVSEEDTNKIMHDFALNETASRIECAGDSKSPPSEGIQERSPGILMIVEVEDYSEKKFSEASLSKALEAIGFSVDESISEGKATMLLMKQGYVTVRRWPEENYCALDILLWSEFDKQPLAKKALITALGGTVTKSSSFRVVTGGMFGVSTWKEDEAKRGPDELPRCEGESTATIKQGTAPLSTSDIDSVLISSLELISDKKANLAVVCGNKSSCSSVSALASSAKVANVVPLYACPEIENINEFHKDATDAMKSCRISLASQVREAVASFGKLRGIIIDPSANYMMGQIAHSIFGTKVARNALLTEAVFMAAPYALTGSEWRHTLVEEFRINVIRFNPDFSASLRVFGADDKFTNISLLSTGDEDFWFRLMDVVETINKKFSAKVYQVLGGKEPYQPHYQPPTEKYFHHSDYDQSKPLEQYMSQQATGLQAIIQFEHADGSDGVKRVDLSTILSEILKELGLSPKKMKSYSDYGEGQMISAMYDSGSAILLWDGRAHIDFNLFSYEQDEQVVSRVENLMKEKVPGLFVMLRDFHPRGYGRNVNWSRDVTPRVEPHWAISKK